MISEKENVLQLLRSLPFLQGQDFDKLVTSKTILWNCIKTILRNNINYSFDEKFQKETNQILEQLDQILGTKQNQKIKKKRNQQYGNIPYILRKIMSEYYDSYLEQQNSEDQFQLKQRILQSTFENELRRFTFSELKSILEIKIKNIKKNKKRTDQEKEILIVSEEFIDFFNEAQIDFDVVDNLILDRLHQRPNDSLNSSYMSQISIKSRLSLKSFDNQSNEQPQLNQSVTERNQISQLIRNLSINGSNESNHLQPVSEESNQPKRQNLFIKKENPVLIATKIEEKKEIIEPKANQKEQEEQKQLDFIPTNNPNTKNSVSILHHINIQKTESTQQRRRLLFVQNQSNNRIENKNQSNQIQNQRQLNQNVQYVRIQEVRVRPQPVPQNPPRQNIPDIDSTISLDHTFIRDEDIRNNDLNSKLLIERYSTQSRFTNGKYQVTRELQVKQIVRHQLNPLIQVLRQITTRQIDRFSPCNQQIEVEFYGSFANKCGFRRISDVNINLNVKGLKQANMRSTMFKLRDLLDSYRKNGKLSELNLRSVIYSEAHGEVILSHKNNINKVREGNVVNFIYLTINRKQFVFSSKFINQVIYNAQDKTQYLAHLTNILHLFFKTNCILDHKDMYHTWWTQTYQDKIKKQKSQSRYVSISINSLHLMILYFFQHTGRISKISYSKEQKRYDFEFINDLFTLFENFVAFLKFYSSEGDYKKFHAGKKFIDVVERPSHQEKKVQILMERLSYKIEKQDSGYLFAFIHPMTSELIEADNGMSDKSFISYQILKGSHQEKLFFEKIDRMIRIVEGFRPNQNFEPNLLFEYNDGQME